MKHSTILATILLITMTSFTQLLMAASLPVIQDFTLEAKDSKKKKTPILVLFMSKTCTYCEKVLQDFLLPMQRDPEYKNKVILRQIETGSTEKLVDFDGKVTTQKEFSSRFKIWAVPTVMLFDSHGHELTKIVGLLTLDYYWAYLDDAITESQDKIKKENNNLP